MLPFRPLFVAGLVLLTSCAKAPPPTYFDSLRLVNAMREDELMLQTVKAASTVDEQDAACVGRYEFPELTDIPARQISDKMTAAEVDDALKYFQSAAGHKYVRHAELTSAEQAELEQFKQRPAGRKLLQDRITADTASMQEATRRFAQHVDDCSYLRQNEPHRLEEQDACKSKPIASADHVCLAHYTVKGSGATRQAGVEISCRRDGKSLRTDVDLYTQSPVALRWSPTRELEILIQNDKLGKIQSDGGGGPQRVRIAKRKPSDPPIVECIRAGQPDLHMNLATMLPLGSTMSAWRDHSRKGLCLMTARVPKESVPGATEDVLVQFRRHRTVALPFATSELAFIVELHGSVEKPAHVQLASNPLQLIDQQPQRFMVAGKEAEALLQNLTSQPGQVTVERDGSPSYSLPISRQDFDFAYADFSECLAGLKTT